MVVCPPELMVALIQKQVMLATNLRALYVRVNQKAQALSGERVCSRHNRDKGREGGIREG